MNLLTNASDALTITAKSHCAHRPQRHSIRRTAWRRMVRRAASSSSLKLPGYRSK
jgi:hypothetical protein